MNQETLHKRLSFYLLTLVFLLLAKPAYAQVPLILLVLVGRVYALPVICTVIIVEALLLHFFFDMSWRKAALASFVVNLVSALVGFIGFSFVKYRYLVSPLFPIKIIRDITTIAGIAFMDCLIELPCIRFLFNIPLTAKRIMIFFLGNAITGLFVVIIV